MLIIGIDPDSEAHGVAVYENGQLIYLKAMQLERLRNYLIAEQQNAGMPILCAVENVCGNTATFRTKDTKTRRFNAKLGHSVGMVHQACVELIRMLDAQKIPYELHKISKEWKDPKSKPLFEKITGWKGQSNEDTRSAAYMGFLSVNKHEKRK